MLYTRGNKVTPPAKLLSTPRSANKMAKEKLSAPTYLCQTRPWEMFCNTSEHKEYRIQ